jgi:hypothetical protein
MTSQWKDSFLELLCIAKPHCGIKDVNEVDRHKSADTVRNTNFMNEWDDMKGSLSSMQLFNEDRKVAIDKIDHSSLSSSLPILSSTKHELVASFDVKPSRWKDSIEYSSDVTIESDLYTQSLDWDFNEDRL